MANDFDEFPIYDKLVKDNGFMADNWASFMANFFMNLISYLTQHGVMLPPLTTAQRNSIQTPINGQMIYNTTLGSAQYFKAGTWTSF